MVRDWLDLHGNHLELLSKSRLRNSATAKGTAVKRSIRSEQAGAAKKTCKDPPPESITHIPSPTPPFSHG